jgi:hypothetical protein
MLMGTSATILSEMFCPAIIVAHLILEPGKAGTVPGAGGVFPFTRLIQR